MKLNSKVKIHLVGLGQNQPEVNYETKFKSEDPSEDNNAQKNNQGNVPHFVNLKDSSKMKMEGSLQSENVQDSSMKYNIDTSAAFASAHAQFGGRKGHENVSPSAGQGARVHGASQIAG